MKLLSHFEAKQVDARDLVLVVVDGSASPEMLEREEAVRKASTLGLRVAAVTVDEAGCIVLRERDQRQIGFALYTKPLDYWRPSIPEAKNPGPPPPRPAPPAPPPSVRRPS